MRLIKRKTLQQYIAANHMTAAPLSHWAKVIQANDFANFVALRAKFPKADQVTVKSGGIVTIFNIKSSRLITAIHYRGQRVYLMRFLSHAEYDLNIWKQTL